ncbi:MAG: hypothetical protein H7834_16055 [Magnetococcus sp. YQC-9]
MALIKDAAESGSRGGSAGPVVHVDRVKARSTDTYELKFRGKESARILVKGDGDNDLDCFVYDQNHGLVAQDTDSTDSCLMEWTPKWEGKFYIKVKNNGAVYSDYLLMTN